MNTRCLEYLIWIVELVYDCSYRFIAACYFLIWRLVFMHDLDPHPISTSQFWSSPRKNTADSRPRPTRALIFHFARERGELHAVTSSQHPGVVLRPCVIRFVVANCWISYIILCIMLCLVLIVFLWYGYVDIPRDVCFCCFVMVFLYNIDSLFFVMLLHMTSWNSSLTESCTGGNFWYRRINFVVFLRNVAPDLACLGVWLDWLGWPYWHGWLVQVELTGLNDMTCLPW